MKNIAILLPAMRMGGAEKVFLNFLSDLKQYYKVTVILNKREGELLNELPEQLEVLEHPILSFKQVVRRDIQKINWKGLLFDFIYYFRVKSNRISEKDYEQLISRMPMLERKFDCAIAYVGNVSTQIFELKHRIMADKKIVWIHGETNELHDSELFGKIYSSFDKIYTVSQVSRKHFIEKYPSCSFITDVYYNRIVAQDIVEKAKMPVKFGMNPNSINIVTVGRMSPEKGQILIPDIVRILRSKNMPIEWYMIGDGTEKTVIENRCSELQMSPYVHFLGTITNPYPYMKACDIYVQPSFEEGYSTTICEAGILGKPIVGTITSGGITEQIIDGFSGLLAQPTADSLSCKIEYLITHPDEKQKIQENIQRVDFSNKNEIYKICNVI